MKKPDEMAGLNKKKFVGYSLVLLCLITLLTYINLLLKRPFFFDWDEWSILINFLETNYFTWLIQPHLGHIFPIGKILFSLEITCFRDNYVLYVITNMIIHLLNSLILFVIIKKIIIKIEVCVFITLIYLISWNHIENLIWGMQISVLTSTFFSLVAFYLVLQGITHGSPKFLLIFLLVLLSAFSFNLALLLPTFLIIFVSFHSSLNDNFKIVAMLAFCQLMTLGIYHVIAITEFEFVHRGASTKQFSKELINLDYIEKCLIYLVHSNIFLFPYFLTSLSSGTTLNQIPPLFEIIKEFSIFEFVGSKKFFIILNTLLFLAFFKILPKKKLIFNLLLFYVYFTPFTLLLALVKSQHYESVFQCRYYSYIGAFIVIYLAFLLRAKITIIKYKEFINIFLLLLLSWNTTVTFAYLHESDYKFSSLNVINSYNKITKSNRRGSDIFNPIANPELTIDQARKIHNFMKK